LQDWQSFDTSVGATRPGDWLRDIVLVPLHGSIPG
jgi:hypothetical protein